jgi:hypothetical protein
MVVAGGKPAKISAKYINGDLPLQGFSVICSVLVFMDRSIGFFHNRAIPYMVVTLIKAVLISALPLKVCHKKQEKFHPTLEAIDGKEP